MPKKNRITIPPKASPSELNCAAYGDCIENRCATLLYLSGPPVSCPLPSTVTITHDYPLYVPLVDDRDSQLTSAQAYAILGLVLSRCTSEPAFMILNLHRLIIQSNLGGFCDTWLFRTLIGAGTNSPCKLYLKDEDDTYSQQEFNYPGYQIRIPDADENHGAALLPLQPTKRYINLG